MNTLRLVLACCALSGTALGAGVGDFPVKPVRMIVPIGPGSSMDITARLLAQKLNERWERPVVIDNRPGAGTIIGAELVARANPDGYTLLFGASSLAIAPFINRKLTFDATRDLEPVGQVSSRHNVLTVAPGSPANSVKDLIALAKAKPGSQSYGSGGGTGSSDHLVGELFRLLAKFDALHIPHKSGPQAVTSLLSGQTTFYFGGIPVQLPLIKAGKLKPLGTSGAKRSPHLPDVPTLAEAGVPGYEVDVWYALFAAKGTAAAITSKIAADARHMLFEQGNRERFSSLGVDPVGGDPAALRTLVAGEIQKWQKVIAAANIVAE